MSAPSDPRTLVLHGLRLKGFAEADVVSEVVAVPDTEAQVVLDSLLDDGLVTRRDGRLSGFTLTPLGRSEHARLLAEELAALDLREAIHDAYRSFLQHNADLLTVCTRWQLREVDGQSVINDHQDRAYDEEVIAQLTGIHDRIIPVCAELAGALARYSLYGPRLGAALERLHAGEIEWFTKPMIPSYHTVWFELHEDLLATLGIERGSEKPA